MHTATNIEFQSFSSLEIKTKIISKLYLVNRYEIWYNFTNYIIGVPLYKDLKNRDNSILKVLEFSITFITVQSNFTCKILFHQVYLFLHHDGITSTCLINIYIIIYNIVYFYSFGWNSYQINTAKFMWWILNFTSKGDLLIPINTLFQAILDNLSWTATGFFYYHRQKMLYVG